MALPALADTSALATWLGEEITPGDTPRAASALSAASTLIRSETGQTWVDDAGQLTAVPDAVALVTVQVAGRLWRNPSGVVQDTTGPFTVRWAEAAGQGLYLTSTEKAILGPFRIRRPLWTQRYERDDDLLQSDDTVWVDVVGGEPMPWYPAAELAED